LQVVRGSLPGQEQERSEAQSDQHGRQAPLRKPESVNWEFFLSLPEIDRNKLSHTQVKDSQLLEPLFEFSGLARAAERRRTSSC